MASKSIITVAIVGDNKLGKPTAAASRDLDKLAGKYKKVGDFSRAAGRVVATAGLALAAGAVVGFKSVTDAASDLQESTSKAGVIFGKDAAGVVKWSKTTASTMGLSQRAALNFAGSLGNVFTQVGSTTGEASKMSKAWIGLASDVASFNNADPSEVLNAMQSATRGEFDALQAFAPMVNAAAIETKALSMSGKDNAKQLTEQEKLLALNALMFEQTGAAQGDFERTSDSAANSQKRLTAQFDDAKAKIGTGFLPILSKVTGWLADNLPGALAKAQEFAGRLTSWWQANWPSIKAAVQLVVDWFNAEALPRIQLFVASIVAKVSQVIAWFKTNWPAIQEAVGHVLAAIQAYWNTFGKRILDNVMKVWAIISQVIKIAVNLIQGIIKTVVALINGDWGKAWNAIKETFARVWGSIPKILGAALGIVKNVLSAAFEVWKSAIRAVFDWIMDKFGDVAGGLGRALSGVAGMITAPFRAAIDGVKRMWNNTLGGKGFSAPSWVPGIGGKGFTIPKLHSGGVFDSGRGEGLALLQDGETVFTPGQMRALTAAGNGVRGGGDVIVNMPAGVDPDAITRAMQRHNRRNGRAA